MSAEPGSIRGSGWRGLAAPLLYVVAALAPTVAAPIPLEAFAARPGIQHASISPDGRYLALLGAQRNAELFNCAVSIAGISDVAALIAERYLIVTRDIVKRQAGTDPAKVQRDSPRAHAAEFTLPIKDARHSLERGSERETLLRELEAFLAKNVPATSPN